MSQPHSESIVLCQPVSGKALPVNFAMLVFCVLAASSNVSGQVAPRATDPAPAAKSSNTPRHSPSSARKPLSRRPRTVTPGVSRGTVSEQSDNFVDLGDKFAEKSKWRAAEVAYKEAISLSPGNADAYAGLGTLYNDQGRHGDAFAPFNRARQSDPSNPLASYGLGYAYMRGQRYNDAVGFFKQAISAQPDFVQAYFDLGLSYVALSNKQAALSQYEKLKELDSVMAQELLTEINKK
jgi:tetratricopeptide (TPR) repeat protein